jgi:hypothetical protein
MERFAQRDWRMTECARNENSISSALFLWDKTTQASEDKHPNRKRHAKGGVVLTVLFLLLTTK